jgi:hypothetical protein
MYIKLDTDLCISACTSTKLGYKRMNWHYYLHTRMSQRGVNSTKSTYMSSCIYTRICECCCLKLKLRYTRAGFRFYPAYLHRNMHTCALVHVHTFINACTHISTHIHAFVHKCVHKRIQIHINTYLCVVYLRDTSLIYVHLFVDLPTMAMAACVILCPHVRVCAYQHIQCNSTSQPARTCILYMPSRHICLHVFVPAHMNVSACAVKDTHIHTHTHTRAIQSTTKR